MSMFGLSFLEATGKEVVLFIYLFILWLGNLFEHSYTSDRCQLRDREAESLTLASTKILPPSKTSKLSRQCLLPWQGVNNVTFLLASITVLPLKGRTATWKPGSAPLWRHFPMQWQEAQDGMTQ